MTTLRVANVAWQFNALRGGFKLAVRHDALRTFGVTDEDLHEIVCGRAAAGGAGAGTEDFDIRATVGMCTLKSVYP